MARIIFRNLIGLLCVTTSIVSAQIANDYNSKLLESELKKVDTDPRKTEKPANGIGAGSASVSAPVQTMGKISLVGQEKNYLVGSGDKLGVMVWTTVPERFSVCVESNGYALVPGVGSVLLNNKTLAEAQDKVRGVLKSKYNNIKIDVFLDAPKVVAVTITGSVNKPGEYYVSGTKRISDVISMVGGIAPEGNPRAITISNPTLPETSIDLVRYTRTNETECPFIRSGDKIHVTSSSEKISINGAVTYPGKYDFKQGETLEELFQVSGGLQRGVDSLRILVTRFIDERDSVVRFEVTTDQAKSFVVYKDDYVFVPVKKDYRLTREVTISGEVVFPGKYVVRDDKTRLVDLIGLAGGLTKEAYLPGSKVNRVDFSDVGFAEYERLKVLNQSDLSPDEKSYLKYRDGSKNGQVSLDFEELMRDDQSVDNIIVRGGDEIFIARRGLSVNIMGAVLKPGLVDYKEGEDLGYYIHRTGGYQRDAERRRIKIIKGGTETWLRPHHVDKIEVGDAIWVPEKPYVDRKEVAKDILSIAGGIASIVLATITVMKYIDEK